MRACRGAVMLAALAAVVLAGQPALAAPVVPQGVEKSPSAARYSRTLELILFGAAAACYATAGGVALSARGQQERMKGLLADTEARPNTAEAASLERTLILKSQIINGALVGGSALVLGGLVTAGIRRYRILKDEEVRVTLVPGGGAIGLARAF